METPPPTTLSTPSPTTSEPEPNRVPEQNPQSSQMLVKPMFTKPVYIIVATALNPPLGIGLRGSLPWQQLKKDMAFFRKATTGSRPTGTETKNAVLMGRKTWESIPVKFRPLSDRVNVILTKADEHGVEALARTIKTEMEQSQLDQGQSDQVQSTVHKRYISSNHGAAVSLDRPSPFARVLITNSLRLAVDLPSVDKVFCIGGAQIYQHIINDSESRPLVRVLQTQVRKLDGSAFECDTFFPEDMEEGNRGWEQVSRDTVRDWVGPELDVPQADAEWAVDEKAAAQIRVVGWQQKSR